jgi:hypothetical protein
MKNEFLKKFLCSIFLAVLFSSTAFLLCEQHDFNPGGAQYYIYSDGRSWNFTAGTAYGSNLSFTTGSSVNESNIIYTGASIHNFGISYFDNHLYLTSYWDNKLAKISLIDNSIAPGYPRVLEGVYLPHGLVVDQTDGSTWVCDLNNSMVRHYSSSLTLVESLSVGTEPVNAIIHDGRLYVADREEDKVYVIDKTTLDIVDSFKIQNFDPNWAEGFIDLFIYSGKLYIVSEEVQGIVKMNLDGSGQHTIALQHDGQGYSAWGIYITDGEIYLNEWSSKRIIVTDMSGNELRYCNLVLPPGYADFYIDMEIVDNKIYIPSHHLAGNDTIGGHILVLDTSFTSPVPRISLSKNELSFGAATSLAASDPQDVLVENSGEGTLNWSASSDRTWLQFSPASGTNYGVILVTVDAAGLDAGTYTGTISVSDSNAENSPQTVNVTLMVYSANSTSPPFGVFSTPVDGSTVSSSVAVTGWVLDDIGVESIKIYNGADYLGDALLIEGARPDIEAAYPGYPQNNKAGWGYMLLTNFLPGGGNGTYTLYARAADLEGHRVTLGKKTVTCTNANAVKPFGAIDTPSQGGTASGSSFRNHGWVLTPMPNSIPTDGSTIDVYVDSVNLGHPTYNIYREDIAALFPGYANKDGAHGYFDFDSTAYGNGVHTIFWIAVDNAGNADGIGSRFFTIQNSESRNSGSSTVGKCKGIDKLPVNYNASVEVRKGYGKNSGLQKIHTDDRGILTINTRELERVVIKLSHEASIVTGYMVVGNQLRPLPIGSTLDPKTAIFYWQPVPGFIGEYQLLFVEKDQDKNMLRKNIIININPLFTPFGSDK